MSGPSSPTAAGSPAPDVIRVRAHGRRGADVQFDLAVRAPCRPGSSRCAMPQREGSGLLSDVGGRPVDLDTEAYRGRNVIDRGYSDVKQWRGLTTRYDTLGLTYRAGAALRAIIQWLNHLP